MKYPLLLATSLLLLSSAHAQRFLWAETALSGGSGNSNIPMATGSDGSMVLMHIYSQTFSIGGATVDPISTNNVAITKLDANGDHVWTTRLGGNGGCSAGDLVLDTDGNVYASMSMDMGTTISDDTSYSDGGFHAHLVKLDANGHFIRARFASDAVPALASDGDHLFLTHGSIVEKCDTALTTLWSRSIQPAQVDLTTFNYRGVLSVQGDRLLVGGTENFAQSTFTIDTLHGAFGGAGVGFDQYLLIMMDTAGSALWARVSDGSNANQEVINEAAFDDQGDVFVAGRCGSSPAVQFAGSSYANPLAGPNGFAMLLKYSSEGDELWAKPIGVTGQGQGNDVAVNGSGDALVIGGYGGDIALDGFTGPSAGSGYFVFSCASGDGAANWAKFSEGDGLSISTVSPQEYRIAGKTSATTTFDCLGPAGGVGVFAAALDEDAQVLPVASFTYTFDGVDYQFQSTSTDADSLHWDLGDGATSTDVAPTHTYGAGNNYTVTLTAFQGVCTNVATIQLFSVGLAEGSTTTSILVFPDPADDRITVRSDYSIRALRLLDAAGRELKRLVPQRRDGLIELDVSDLAPGSYVISLMTDQGRLGRTLVID